MGSIDHKKTGQIQESALFLFFSEKYQKKNPPTRITIGLP